MALGDLHNNFNALLRDRLQISFPLISESKQIN